MGIKIIRPSINKLERKRDVEGLIKVLSSSGWYKIDDQLCSNLAEALGRIGEPAIEPLANAISEITKTGSYRGVTIYPRNISTLYDALVKIGEPSVEALVKLFCEYPYSRSADKALIELGEPVIEPLVEILKDADYAGMIGRIPDIFKNIGRPAVNPLIEVIKSKGERKPLLAAIEYKSRGDEVYRTFRMEKVNDKTIPNSEKVNRGIIKALMSIGEPAVVPLINVLGDPKKEVCVEVIYMLYGLSGYPTAMAVMRSLDREYEEQVKTKGIYI